MRDELTGAILAMCAISSALILLTLVIMSM